MIREMADSAVNNRSNKKDALFTSIDCFSQFFMF